MPRVTSTLADAQEAAWYNDHPAANATDETLCKGLGITKPLIKSLSRYAKTNLHGTDNFRAVSAAEKQKLQGQLIVAFPILDRSNAPHDWFHGAMMRILSRARYSKNYQDKQKKRSKSAATSTNIGSPRPAASADHTPADTLSEDDGYVEFV